MVDYYEEVGAASGMSELLLDWGAYLTAGRRPKRAIVLGAWFLTLGGALALWRWFPWLFNHFPGWAVMAGGFWAILFVLSLGLFGAAVKYSPANEPRDVGARSDGVTQPLGDKVKRRARHR